ncbi:phage protease [Chromohalobacter israelensis]|uniref:phage protease n=1 Tax=Chromohalobacter israelensis TaxID=141390 RepID=UPI00351DA168
MWIPAAPRPSSRGPRRGPPISPSTTSTRRCSTEVNGQPAPASGWVDPHSLEWRDDGLYGRIDWAKAAKATPYSIVSSTHL